MIGNKVCREHHELVYRVGLYFLLLTVHTYVEQRKNAKYKIENTENEGNFG